MASPTPIPPSVAWGKGPALDVAALCVPPSSPTITTLMLCHENTPFFVEAKPPAVSSRKYFASNIKGSCFKHPAMTPFPCGQYSRASQGPLQSQGSPARTSAATGLGPGALRARGMRHKEQEPSRPRHPQGLSPPACSGMCQGRSRLSISLDTEGIFLRSLGEGRAAVFTMLEFGSDEYSTEH